MNSNSADSLFDSAAFLRHENGVDTAREAPETPFAAQTAVYARPATGAPFLREGAHLFRGSGSCWQILPHGGRESP